MKKKKTWDQLSHAVRLRLYRANDPRVPADFKPRPVGRQPGYHHNEATRQKIGAANSYRNDPTRVAQRAYRAINTLLRIYGSPKAVILAIRAHK